jgi:transcriptional regulator with PAS, ATPase and Fis domain
MGSDQEIKSTNINFHTQIVDDEDFAAVEKTLKEYNTDIIKFFLKKYSNNVVKVAKKLDIGKSTIYNLIKAGDIPKLK